MQYSKHKLLRLFIIMAVFFCLQSLSAQIRLKPANFSLDSKTGYDSNILKVASSVDSNRIASASQNFEATMTQWSYWSKNIRTFFYVNGEYNLFLGNGQFNTWDIKAYAKSRARLLNNKDAQWGRRLDFTFDLKYKLQDNYYSDREFGEEYIINIGGNIPYFLGMGDLFDRQIFTFAPGFDFDLNRWLALSIGYTYDINDYKEMKVDSLDYLYSLSSDDRAWEMKFVAKPVDILDVSFLYYQTDRSYEHKLARDLNGRIHPDMRREYTYTGYKFDADLILDAFDLKLAYGHINRDDRFEGYYNYKSNTLKGSVSYAFAERFNIWLKYNRSWKDYANLTYRGALLENTYDKFETGLKFSYTPNLHFWPSYRYDAEGSSYYKFNYSRHRILFNIEYDL